MNKFQKTNQSISILKTLLIILGVIILCLLLVIILASLAPYVNQYDYSYVGINFAEALMQNNSRLARRLSIPSQWERIDEWMSEHETFKCPSSWNFDDINSGSVSGVDDEGAHVSYYYICWVDEYYEFEIEEIVLQRQNNRWQVVDWSEVQEWKE
jgi:hypothetical protein